MAERLVVRLEPAGIQPKPRLPQKVKYLLLSLIVVFFMGMSAGLAHVLWPANPRNLTLEQMAEIQGVNGKTPGFTLISDTGEEMAHALGCPNCGHPVARLLIVYEKKPTEPGWRSVDLKDKVSRVYPRVDEPTLVASR